MNDARKAPRLFMCWSGDRSQVLAGRLKRFLEAVLGMDSSEIFLSTNVSKGVRWFDEILWALSSSEAGILCLTPENLASPWLHFEAGALVTGLHRGPAALRDHVFTYLLGGVATRLSGPLAQYQATSTTKDDTWRLVFSLAEICGGQEIDRGAISERFDREWPPFERDVQATWAKVQTLVPDFEEWFREKSFDHALDQCTEQNWIQHYECVAMALERLKGNQVVVRDACPPYQLDLYLHLTALVDAYKSDIRALLLPAEHFQLDDKTGRLLITPRGKLLACENRRMHIRDAVSRILDPLGAPTTRDAVRFWLSDSFEQCKLLVHRLEHGIQNGGGDHPRDMARAKVHFESRWDLDRIYGYLAAEYLCQDSPDAVAWLRRAAEQELQRCRAAEGLPKLMPLHYALGALLVMLGKRSGKPKAVEVTSITKLIGNVRDLVSTSCPSPNELLHLDRGGQVERTLTEIELRLASEPAAPLMSTANETAIRRAE